MDREEPGPAADLEDMLRARKWSVQQIAAKVNLSYWQVYGFAVDRKIPIRGRWLSEAEEHEIVRLIEEEGLSQNAAGRKTGAGRMQVSRLMQRRRAAIVSDASEELRPETLREPRRCPSHGMVTLWPCLMCAAEAKRSGRC